MPKTLKKSPRRLAEYASYELPPKTRPKRGERFQRAVQQPFSTGLVTHFIEDTNLDTEFAIHNEFAHGIDIVYFDDIVVIFREASDYFAVAAKHGWKATNAMYQQFIRYAWNLEEYSSREPTQWVLLARDETANAIEDYARFFDATAISERIATSRAWINESPVDTDFKAQTKDESLSVACRLEALANWLIEDRQTASAYLMYELRGEPPREWHDGLILLAEDTWFDGEANQNVLVEHLLETAIHRRNDSDPMAEPVTHAAIRRAASLISVDQVDRLLPFLSPAPIKTTLVTLISLVRIIEVDVPRESHASGQFRERIIELVAKYADPDIYGRGEVDTMLFACLLAIAILLPSDFHSSIEQVAQLKRPYLLIQLRDQLCRIREGWRHHTRTFADARIEAALAAISQLVQHMGA